MYEALTRPLAPRAYTGVGSRSTPIDVLRLMSSIALKLATETSYVLRSGGADGADTAFASGAGARAEIYLPWRSFSPGQHPDAHLMTTGDDPDARAIAEQCISHWDRLSRGARALHTRNVHQVLGRDLDRPSRFLICWTEDGLVTGGTATAIKVAQAHRVVTYNLANDLHRTPWQAWVDGRTDQNPFDTACDNLLEHYVDMAPRRVTRQTVTPAQEDAATRERGMYERERWAEVDQHWEDLRFGRE